jgi:hypothetical protein
MAQMEVTRQQLIEYLERAVAMADDQKTKTYIWMAIRRLKILQARGR